MKYNIYAGVGGGFGGASYQYTADFDFPSEAEDAAYDAAIQEYESYEGMHGLKTFFDLASELGYEDDHDISIHEVEIQEAYDEELNTWCDYFAVPTDEDDLEEEYLEYLE